MKGKEYKTEHGCFNEDHVRSFESADEFIEGMAHTMNYLPEKEKSAFLKKVYFDICPEKKVKKSKEKDS